MPLWPYFIGKYLSSRAGGPAHRLQSANHMASLPPAVFRARLLMISADARRSEPPGRILEFPSRFPNVNININQSGRMMIFKRKEGDMAVGRRGRQEVGGGGRRWEEVECFRRVVLSLCLYVKERERERENPAEAAD